MRETTEGTSASVSTTTDRPAEPEGERSMGRAVLISSVAAAVVVFTAVTLGIGTAIDNYRAGAVLGAFCSAWVGRASARWSRASCKRSTTTGRSPLRKIAADAMRKGTTLVVGLLLFVILAASALQLFVLTR